ncbi:MAG: sugar phosphate isomerase/epimerase [Saprospiraceae bacterium]
MKRRTFIKAVPSLSLVSSAVLKNSYPLSCATYNWLTFFRREGKEWGKLVEDDIKIFAQSGFTAIEPNIDSVQMGAMFINALKKYNIQMPSIYVNTLLHKPNEVEQSIQKVIEIAELVKSYGTKIIVTNPSPIAWGGIQNKSDKEIRSQAIALNDLGAKLRARGFTLAYHTHDMEMKAGAREFHHMLQNSSSANVSFCFDVHWIYRGSENSSIAVFDILKMYGHRIAELHLRQSDQGIWSEIFTAEGDIDYAKFAAQLKQMNVKPHLVLEQCVEEKSPNTKTVVDAHRQDLKNVKSIFGRT